MKNAVIIIVYNQKQFLQRQIDLFRKYLKDEHDIIIVDNSSDKEIAKELFSIAEANGLEYVKSECVGCNASNSHAFAMNIAQNKYYDSYKQIGYFDHDLFPIAEFTYSELLGESPIAGIYQERRGNGKIYKHMWPGCFICDTAKADRKKLKYSPCIVERVALDTGGELYHYILELPSPSYLREQHINNPYWTKPPYNFYSLIQDKFMHFINGSNWNNQSDNAERLETLFRILNERTA